ncbi:IS3 family transposase [Acholeplasma laidlawii]|uniref:IS3 family transposase n=1 Tax=Acholeplasma laidlawii TaxID=2148 RepID=UPI0009F58F70|nr:IS3 family transposase [Acholeplasma laidlawii]
MRITQEMKLKMVEEHLLKGKSLSHISQTYDNYDVSNIKYNVNLYKKFGSEVFLNREGKIYYRDTKLLAIKRVLEGNESIRSVALYFELTDPTILQDWIKNYKNKGEAGVQDTYPRKNYVLKDERARNIVDKKLKQENERLRAEIEYLKKSQSLTQKLEGATNKDKVLIVAGLRKKHKLEHLLAIIDMAPSVYDYNLSVIKNKVNKYQEIEDKIDELYLKKHKKRQHYNAIYIELKNLGYKIGNNKVLEIMRAKGYLKFRSKKWRKYSSYEGDKGYVKPNHMKQTFITTRPFEKAGTDITMFRVKNAAVYLSPVIDFNTREVLSYVAAKDAKVDKVMHMLTQLKQKHGNQIEGMMIQSDQGIQYQNSRYQERLIELGMIQSMSRKGNCLDNSPTENFFGRIKDEMWYGHEDEFNSADELIKGIDEYIEYYNNTRIVLKLKTNPIDYRNRSLNNI